MTTQPLPAYRPSFVPMELTVRIIAYTAALLINVGHAVLGWSAERYNWLPEAWREVGDRVHAFGLTLVAAGIAAALGMSLRRRLYSDGPGDHHTLHRRVWVSWTFGLGTFLWFSTAFWGLITPNPWPLRVWNALQALGIALGHVGCWRAARYQTAWTDVELQRRRDAATTPMPTDGGEH